MTHRMSSTRRLSLLVDKLDDRMAELATKKRTPAEDIAFCNAERRYWPLQQELLRRLDERDELLADKNSRIERLQAIMARTPGVKPWSNDRESA